ncbi:unnamed protein product [Scytosiphon promiscuus]
MPRPKVRARNPMLSVLSLLSTCTVAFVPPARVMCSPGSTGNALPLAFAPPPYLSRDLPRSRSPSPRRLQRPSLRAGVDEYEGEVENGDGDAGGGAGAGMGLDGQWQVKSGQGRKARGGLGDDVVGASPGQLPEKTRDGQDWAEWAREWREDPQGKADRLVEQWDAESKASGRASSQESARSKKRKKKKKGKGGPSRGVVGSGFGGALRQTKSVPEGLVVSQTGANDGDLVDWSSGQQLAETDRKENMAADWQKDAKHLESLDPSDREKLAEKLRMALGKKQKTKKKAPSRGDSRGFSGAEPAAAAGKSAAKGDGRGALASAAAAAGASPAKDVAGVSVFPTASAAAAAAMDGESEGERFRSAGGASKREAGTGAELGEGGNDSSRQGQGRATLGDSRVGGRGSDQEASEESSGKGAAAVGVVEEEASGGDRMSPGTGETGRTSSQIPLERAMGFGRGVAVVETAAEDGESDEVVHPSVRDEEAWTGEGSSKVEGKLSDIRKFGRGVSVIVERGVGEDSAVSAQERPQTARSSADDRASGFGRGVAFPAERDAGG